MRNFFLILTKSKWIDINTVTNFYNLRQIQSILIFFDILISLYISNYKIGTGTWPPRPAKLQKISQKEKKKWKRMNESTWGGHVGRHSVSDSAEGKEAVSSAVSVILIDQTQLRRKSPISIHESNYFTNSINPYVMW